MWVPPAEGSGLSRSLFGANLVLTLSQIPYERILPSRYPYHSWERPQGEWWGQRGTPTPQPRGRLDAGPRAPGTTRMGCGRRVGSGPAHKEV